VDGKSVPLRPSDYFDDDLDIDDEALDFLAKDIAERSGRAFADTSSNPYYGRVKTVRDLVAFLRAQPTVAA
jgi:hypothetical protein